MHPGTRHHRLNLFLGTLLVALSAGCHSNTTAPTPVLTTDTFSGTLNVLGTDSKFFNVNYALSISDGSVAVTSMNTVASNTPVTTTIGIGFGSPAFDGSCTRSPTYTATAVNIGKELVATSAFGPNTYCVQIFDSGTLTEPINYTLAVKHY